MDVLQFSGYADNEFESDVGRKNILGALRMPACLIPSPESPSPAVRAEP